MERHTRKTQALTAALALLLAFGVLPAGAEVVTDRYWPAIACEALSSLSLPETLMTSAVAVPPHGAAPGYCRVLATVAPETDVELRLPDAWQQRLLHVGGAGLDGSIPNLDPNVAHLAQGFAVVASNGGHRDPTGGPARFLDNPTIIQDYAHGAIGKTVYVAKAVIRFYYGRRARFSYFAGCSNGGRGAFNAAAHYAAEYDGVIAGAPSRNAPGVISGWTRASLLPVPSAAKLASLYRAQLAQCDDADGLVDGIISNPDACDFDPAMLACPPGVDNASCLTDGEIQAVNTIRSDVVLANGRLVYSRLGIGNPGTGFGVFMPLGPAGAPTIASFGPAHLQFIVFGNPGYDPATYDVDADFRTVVNVIEGDYDFSADTRPLARYLRAGKKMIVWHGAEDTALSHLDTVRLFDRLVNVAGPGATNARLYTPPGVLHCGGGPGADRFDAIDAIARWVEQGVAPRTLIGSKASPDGTVRFTRPVCEYPKYPRYIGKGDPNVASSFRCVGPRRANKRS